MIHIRDFNSLEKRNVKLLVDRQVEYATLQITETGFKKSIMDATAPVRAYLSEHCIHDYESQKQGPDNKVLVKTCILSAFEKVDTYSSLYRPVTKKGDPRIWIYHIKDKGYVCPDDILALIAYQKKLYVVNLTKTDLEEVCHSSLASPVRDLIDSISREANSTSKELLSLIRNRLSDWTPTALLADTGVGRAVEAALGIPMNASKQPDYKGIELKSKRERARVRSSLFTQAPDWGLSMMKSGKQIVEKYGYMPQGYDHKALHVTLSAQRPNSQGLGLNVDFVRKWLEANEYDLRLKDYPKVSDVAVWQLKSLHERLLSKHRETFWIDVMSKIENGKEYFRVTTIDHTKHPLPSQFDILLQQGKITVDFLLCRNSGGDTYSFKIKKSELPLLFPESQTYILT